jgi:thiosulfate reductase cytochrome b subunit
MGIALITFCVVFLLVTLVLVWIWIGTRGRRLRNDHEPQLTTAAKHFVADMDSRARQGGARWQAPGQERASRQ